MTVPEPERTEMVAIKENFLDCRDLRHAWKRVGDNAVTEKQKTMLTRRLVCVRCGAIRTDSYIVTRVTVQRVGSTYHYPEGYRVKGGLSTEEARLMLFKRWGLVDA